ncbi:MAG: hypothetical protein E4H07_06855 [Nitrosomonadales bacterium]|nr:MAG: hypothetical protein E4H07_06855 [Nitrosomonadales bacterium]
MGNEPLEEETPLSLGDFPDDIQLAFDLYHKIQDTWEFNSGTYLGKNLTGIDGLMNILEIEDKRTALNFVLMIDSSRQEYLTNKKKGSPKEQ